MIEGEEEKVFSSFLNRLDQKGIDFGDKAKVDAFLDKELEGKSEDDRKTIKGFIDKEQKKY